ncbi:MAG: SurA N-terminal domain-containing protein [Tatlockia sp.]|nr:SurA N-terminal domain-containing protein [Tatlockia sp.]
MLQKLNERIQGVVAWIVIIMIAVTFTLFGVDYYMQSHQASDSEVEVNGQMITKQAYDVAYRRSRQQNDLSQMTAASESALKKQVLQGMISNEVSIQAARKAGFEIAAEQANSAILGIPQFQQDGHFSPERYQQALSGAMFTPETFRNEVKQGMLLNQQRFAFMGSAFALPEEIKRFVKLYMQTRDYDFVEIPASKFIKNIQISEESINKYFQEHPKEFIAPEKVTINYVRLSTKQIKDKISVTPAQIKQYYDDNKSNFLTPAQWQVAHILFALPEDASDETKQHLKQKALDAFQTLQADPSQFDELLKTKSDDKLSLGKGGILPWMVAGQSGFDKTLAELTKPGEISEPVESAHGYEIFKLIAYKAAILKPLTEVQTQIKEQLVTELSQAQYAQALEQLGDLSYQSPDSLSPVADALKLPIDQSELFSREGGNTELTKNKQVVNAAFSHDVLELGNNSEPIQLDNDSVLVLRVDKHIPAAEKSLAEVKDYISKKLAMLDAEKQAKLLGAELLAKKEDKGQQEKLMQENQLQWRQVEKATRDSDKTDASINDLAFSLARTNSYDGRNLAKGDYVIVRLNKINDGDLKALDKEQQASLEQQIESSYGVMDYDLYINNLISKAKIEKHQ